MGSGLLAPYFIAENGMSFLSHSADAFDPNLSGDVFGTFDSVVVMMDGVVVDPGFYPAPSGGGGTPPTGGGGGTPPTGGGGGTPPVSSVPVPASGLVLLGGLAALFSARRRPA